MSRTITTRVVCHECMSRSIIYDHNESPYEVSADLRRCGWRKDHKGNDLCPYCVKAKGTAKG